VSIGNPSFSKNSPNVLAFDYVDEVNQEFYVLGMNIETNEVDVIAENNGLGWPSFNKNDTRVAFTSDDGAGDYQTGYANLNANKISGSGYTGLFGSTQWPVYFAVGNRDIGDEEITGVEETPSLVQACYPNPFKESFDVRLAKPFTPQTTIELTNIMGQRIANITFETRDNTTVRVNAGDIPTGQYIVKVRQGKTFGYGKVLKVR
jgi:hypothetical protein